MRILIKIGGTLLDSAASRTQLARQMVAALERAQMVVVHGGGKQMSRYLAERGIESRFVNGLRVTSAETLDAVVKVLAGTVNHELVSALVAAGARAVGLSGIDARLAEAEPLDPQLGAVGQVLRTNSDLLRLLVHNGYLPVVACLAADAQGRLYNVNADQMAVACAAGFGADQLWFLTDVEGVLDGHNQTLSRLTPQQSERLIDSGLATGGMRAKLSAAISAIRKGAQQVVIAPGAAPGVLERLLSDERVGTRIVAAAEIRIND